MRTRITTPMARIRVPRVPRAPPAASIASGHLVTPSHRRVGDGGGAGERERGGTRDGGAGPAVERNDGGGSAKGRVCAKVDRSDAERGAIRHGGCSGPPTASM